MFRQPARGAAASMSGLAQQSHNTCSKEDMRMQERRLAGHRRSHSHETSAPSEAQLGSRLGAACPQLHLTDH